MFDAGGSGFDSEIWADSEQLMQSFRRQAYSSVVARLADPASFAALKARLESDPRLTLDVKRERAFYEEQSQTLSRFISYLGITLSVIFSIGAMVGAMITMYAAVASRTGEIGTLRALGFRRASVLGAFLAEALMLGLAGGVIGLALASLHAGRAGVHAQLGLVRRAYLPLHPDGRDRGKHISTIPSRTTRITIGKTIA